MKTPTWLTVVSCILLLGGMAVWYLHFFPMSHEIRVEPLFMRGLKLFSHQWKLPVSSYWRVESDNEGNPRRSSLVLFENGKELGPAHSLHVDVARKGKGRYSHWMDKIIFSASDNTNPRYNRRKYVIRVKRPPQDRVLWAGSVVFFLGLGGLATVVLRRQRAGAI